MSPEGSHCNKNLVHLTKRLYFVKLLLLLATLPPCHQYQGMSLIAPCPPLVVNGPFSDALLTTPYESIVQSPTNQRGSIYFPLNNKTKKMEHSCTERDECPVAVYVGRSSVCVV